MLEQRRAYKGSPPRAWIRLMIVGPNNESCVIDALADTGNPCALIVSQEVMSRFNSGVSPGMSTNFGKLDGGWLRIQIPELSFDADLLCYAGASVVEAVSASHSDFTALAGLPLLRLLEYGGDDNSFWLRA